MGEHEFVCRELTDDIVFEVICSEIRKNLVIELPPPCWEDPLSVFFSVSEPAIETHEYVNRLVQFAQCSRGSFVNALIYLQRLAHQTPLLQLTSLNLHRLLTTSLLVAAKTLDDRCYSNLHYARVGGIPTIGEMNRLELQFLSSISYRTYVAADEYYTMVNSLLTRTLPRLPRYLQCQNIRYHDELYHELKSVSKYERWGEQDTNHGQPPHFSYEN